MLLCTWARSTLSLSHNSAHDIDTRARGPGGGYTTSLQPGVSSLQSGVLSSARRPLLSPASSLQPRLLKVRPFFYLQPFKWRPQPTALPPSLVLIEYGKIKSQDGRVRHLDHDTFASVASGRYARASQLLPDPAQVHIACLPAECPSPCSCRDRRLEATEFNVQMGYKPLKVCSSTTATQLRKRCSSAPRYAPPTPWHSRARTANHSATFALAWPLSIPSCLPLPAWPGTRLARV